MVYKKLCENVKKSVEKMHILLDKLEYLLTKTAQLCEKKTNKSYPHLLIKSCITEFLCKERNFYDNTKT